MGKFEYTPGAQEEKPAARNRTMHGKCEVYGCPRDGHIYTSNWNCRYHAGQHGSSLARITMVLNNHSREFNWYEHVLNATMTDFGMGDIAKDAPYGLQVQENESLKQYKIRLQKHINDLLGKQMKVAA